MTVLRGAGLLSERRQGTSRYYRARPEGMAGLRDFIGLFSDPEGHTVGLMNMNGAG